MNRRSFLITAGFGGLVLAAKILSDQLPGETFVPTAPTAVLDPGYQVGNERGEQIRRSIAAVFAGFNSTYPGWRGEAPLVNSLKNAGHNGSLLFLTPRRIEVVDAANTCHNDGVWGLDLWYLTVKVI